MTELSKTARASTVKEKKERVEESVEEAIRQLRLNLGAGLYITSDRIRKLLECYDSVVIAFRGTTILLETQIDRVKALEQAVIMRDQELEELRTQGNDLVAALPVMIQTGIEMANEAVKIGPIEYEPVTTIEHREDGTHVVMAELPAQEHDEHHLVDFGHHTIHEHKEGA